MVHRGNDFVRKYHWPNCIGPSPTSLLADFQKHVPGRFCVHSVEDFGTRKFCVLVTKCNFLLSFYKITLGVCENGGGTCQSLNKDGVF